MGKKNYCIVLNYNQGSEINLVNKMYSKGNVDNDNNNSVLWNKYVIREM